MKKHNETNLKEAIQGMLDLYKLRGKYQQTRIRQLWPQLMGPVIAQYTTELKVHRNKLFVTISSAPLKQELSMGTDKIKHLFNDHLGEEFLLEVIIR